MSNKKDQSAKQAAEEPSGDGTAKVSGVSRAGSTDPSSAVAAAGPRENAAPAQTVAAGSNAAPIAWLAIIVALIVATGFFYTLLEQQRRDSELLQRVQVLESLTGQNDASFERRSDNLRRQMELQIEGLQAQQQRSEEDFRRSQQAQEQAVGRLEARLASISAQTNSSLSPAQLQTLVTQQLQPLQQSLDRQDQMLLEQRRRLTELYGLSEGDRVSWQLAEVQYLLRLANQRMVMSGDTGAAEVLLRNADKLLRELDDASMLDLRTAVAADLAAVQAVPKLDLQGLYTRLDALIRQTDALVMFRLPQRQESSPAPIEGDWKTRVVDGYDAALKKLSEYVVVSRRDVPVEALMDPQHESLVRQNMRMLLEQAQLAMLSGDERLFGKSLERAAAWVAQFSNSDEQATIAMSRELQAIRDERVSVELPELTTSLQVLDAVMRVRLARSSGN